MSGDYLKKEEKYDLRKLRQELGANSVKYDFGAQGAKPNPTMASSLAPTLTPAMSGTSRASSPTSQARVRPGGDARTNGSKAKGDFSLDAEQGSDKDLASNSQEGIAANARVESKGNETGRPPITNVDKMDNASGDEMDEGDLTVKFFGGFRDMFSCVKSTLALVKKQSRNIKMLEHSIRDLQIVNERRQDEMSILASRCKELEHQMLSIRAGDPGVKVKVVEVKESDIVPAQPLPQAASLLGPAQNQQSKKQQKESKARDQEFKEVIGRLEHQIADIHIDLSKKQASMDRQSFQIHTMKEKMDSLDVRDEMKEVRKNLAVQSEGVKQLQMQVTGILSDPRIENTEKNLEELSSKLVGQQSKTNAWFTDLSAQIEFLKEESAQHKNVIYEKLYERVREDIARQTNRCFKELKTLSDRCHEKFEEYDDVTVYVRDEVPKKLDRDDLFKGLTDADIQETSNLRALLVSQLLHDIQESFDVSLLAGPDLDLALNFAPTESPVAGKAKPKDKDGLNTQVRTSNDSPSPITGSQAKESGPESGRASVTFPPIHASPAPAARESPEPAADKSPMQSEDEMDGSSDRKGAKKKSAKLAPSPSVDQGTPILQSDVLSGLTIMTAANQGDGAKQSGDNKIVSSVHVASHLQSVLTKFYGVLDYDANEQLRTLITVLVQKIQRLQTVVNLKMFRHEARLEMERKLNSTIFEHAMTTLVHQLRHQQLDIALDIPQLLGTKAAKAHARSKIEKLEKLSVSASPTKKGAMVSHSRKDDAASKNEFLPLI